MRIKMHAIIVRKPQQFFFSIFRNIKIFHAF
ncbi:hypothetical protein FHR97_002906 [Halomonas stenophila]|uniref:Uncharacterized protein n=1 Tax=Halomonas stenophila TaxID=795312 RepID=A0A7W5EVA1_9GAMM|nr:hypothetical protein [Halomonas stenophila]